MKYAVVVVVAAACSEARPTPPPCTGDASDCTPHVHPAGILDPMSEAFHSKELARQGWNLALCQGCHGDDFAGGKADASCLTCHAEGPSACVTCHGPRGREAPAGNHAPHLAAGIDCAECHIVPASWDAPGHILNDAPPAEVTFGPRANLTPPRADRRGPPAWDAGTCRNTYCHGDVTRLGGSATQPRWDEPAPAFTCDRCHGAPPPPPDHPRRLDCVSCHPLLPSEHVNGVIDLL
ncbi:MAG TPA: CxxxxCH/CxxCH domain-containing protein [Kofleriaceae bacterium]|nr:CxxxxCH/CxxCH domain-containing protein [Kofleriaceae bacterium]